jgi:hypothetical protein
MNNMSTTCFGLYGYVFSFLYVIFIPMFTTEMCILR